MVLMLMLLMLTLTLIPTPKWLMILSDILIFFCYFLPAILHKVIENFILSSFCFCAQHEKHYDAKKLRQTYFAHTNINQVFGKKTPIDFTLYRWNWNKINLVYLISIRLKILLLNWKTLFLNFDSKMWEQNIFQIHIYNCTCWLLINTVIFLLLAN